MDVIIIDKKLNKIINDNNKLIKIVGIELARKIIQRLQEIEATNNFSEYLINAIGHPHRLVGSLDKLYGITLDGNRRLIVKPISDGLDNNSLEKCYNVELKGVVDYHGEKQNWIIP